MLLLALLVATASAGAVFTPLTGTITNDVYTVTGTYTISGTLGGSAGMPNALSFLIRESLVCEDGSGGTVTFGPVSVNAPPATTGPFAAATFGPYTGFATGGSPSEPTLEFASTLSNTITATMTSPEPFSMSVALSFAYPACSPGCDNAPGIMSEFFGSVAQDLGTTLYQYPICGQE